jgi:hypothetical protein
VAGIEAGRDAAYLLEAAEQQTRADQKSDSQSYLSANETTAKGRGPRPACGCSTKAQKK